MCFFFLYVPYNPQLSKDHFYIFCTKYSLHHVPAPSTLVLKGFFPNFAPNIHWTVFQTPMYFCHCSVTFMPTRGPNAYFLVSNLRPLVFNQSFPNSHHIFLRPRSRCQVNFSALQIHFWLLGGQVHFSCWCLTTLTNNTRAQKIP